MNDKKFCFIMCSNNKQYEYESMLYINDLKHLMVTLLTI